MKILHYLPGLPPVRGGGMVKYALDLIDSERKYGNYVSILVPGAYTHFHKDETRVVKKKWENIDCYHIQNSLPVSGGSGICELSLLHQEGNEHVYIYFLEKVKPQIIHIHSFMGLHCSFLRAAKQLNIPIIYTTHDFYGICPKAILLNELRQCVVTDGSQCDGCVDGNKSTKKLVWEQSVAYRMLKSNYLVNRLEYSQRLVPLKIYIRSFRHNYKKNDSEQSKNVNKNDVQRIKEYKRIQCYYREMFQYVTKFHYNSIQTEEVFRQCLGEKIKGNVIPISNKSIADRRKRRIYGKTLRIGFIGQGVYKGFELLKDAMAALYIKGMQDLECHVYFNPKEKMPAYVISHEPYREADMEKVYDNMDILVLPSICKETFGLVVLEALSHGVPVFVSENVGAKELLGENSGMGIVVKATKNSLQEALESVYCNRELLSQMNLAICKWEKEFDYNKHVQEVLDMYETISKNDCNSEKE